MSGWGTRYCGHWGCSADYFYPAEHRPVQQCRVSKPDSLIPSIRCGKEHFADLPSIMTGNGSFIIIAGRHYFLALCHLALPNPRFPSSFLSLLISFLISFPFIKSCFDLAFIFFLLSFAFLTPLLFHFDVSAGGRNL